MPGFKGLGDVHQLRAIGIQHRLITGAGNSGVKGLAVGTGAFQVGIDIQHLVAGGPLAFEGRKGVSVIKIVVLLVLEANLLAFRGSDFDANLVHLFDDPNAAVVQPQLFVIFQKNDLVTYGKILIHTARETDVPSVMSEG